MAKVIQIDMRKPAPPSKGVAAPSHGIFSRVECWKCHDMYIPSIGEIRVASMNAVSCFMCSECRAVVPLAK